MANDYVLIKCKHCGAWKMLMKFFPSTGLTTRDNSVLEWLDAHGRCHTRRFSSDLGGDPGFSIHTEDDIGKDLDPKKQGYPPPNERARQIEDDERAESDLRAGYTVIRPDYIDRKCSNCHRHRVLEYVNGKLVCEKCHWDQVAQCVDGHHAEIFG